MRLPMKFGVSLHGTTPLPRCRSQKSDDPLQHLGQRLRSRNHLGQVQVARRIEEVRAQEVPPEFACRSPRRSAPAECRWYWSRGSSPAAAAPPRGCHRSRLISRFSATASMIHSQFADAAQIVLEIARSDQRLRGIA